MERAKESGIKDVVVATPDKEIFDLVEKNSGKAVLTGKNHTTGTDRIFEALESLLDNDFDISLSTVFILIVLLKIFFPPKILFCKSPSIDLSMDGTPGRQNTFSTMKPGAPLVGL